MYFMPSDSEIARVQAETGMDKLQAIRHLQQLKQLREMHERKQVRTYPLGKNSEMEYA